MESRTQNTLKITFNDEKGHKNVLLTLNRLNNLVHCLEQFHSTNYKDITLKQYDHYLRVDNKIEIKFIDVNSICIVVISTDLIFNCLRDLLTLEDIENSLIDLLINKLKVKVDFDIKNLVKAIELLRGGIHIYANIC